MIECINTSPLRFRQNDGIPRQESLVATEIASKGQAGNSLVVECLRPVLDELCHAGRKTGCQSSGRQKADIDVLARQGKGVVVAAASHGCSKVVVESRWGENLNGREEDLIGTLLAGGRKMGGLAFRRAEGKEQWLRRKGSQKIFSMSQRLG